MRGKKLLSLVLTLALALSFVPAVSAAPATLSQVVVNMDDSGLVVGSYPDHPGVTVSPEKVRFNWGSCYWIRSDGEYYIGNSKLVEEGRYRFFFSMYYSKKDYTPAPEGVKVILNGAEVRAKVDTEPGSDGNYYISFDSPERKAASLPPISGTAKVEPSELKVGMTVDCVVTGGPSADKLHYHWIYKESTDENAEFTYSGNEERISTRYMYPINAGKYYACQVSADGYSGYLYTPWYYVSAEEYVPKPHSVTVEGGTADKAEAKAGETVTVTAEDKPNYSFTGWTVVSGGTALLDPKSATTSFTMPDQAVSIKANFEYTAPKLAEVKVYMTLPEAGAKPAAPTVKDEKYSVKEYRWIKATADGGSTMADTDVFEVGVQYQCAAVIQAKDAAFDDIDKVTAYINDSTAPGDMEVLKYGLGSDRIRVVGTFNCKEAKETPNPFVDVSASDPFYGAVLWAYYHDPQITNGIDATHFGPMSTVTRGQAVTFLWRAWGCPEPTNPAAAAKFTDMTQDYYKKAVAWAVERGIAKGVDDTHYAPDNTLKTAHIVTFMYRAENPGKDGWYAEAAAWADFEEVTPGVQLEIDDKTDCPRAAVVMLLANLLARE